MWRPMFFLFSYRTPSLNSTQTLPTTPHIQPFHSLRISLEIWLNQWNHSFVSLPKASFSHITIGNADITHQIFTANFTIWTFAPGVGDVKSCDTLFMMNSKASGRKAQTILISSAKRNGMPIWITLKVSLTYNRKSRVPRTLPWITPLNDNLGSDKMPCTWTN